MQINIKHEIPTWTQFERWNIQSASPKFPIKIEFRESKNDDCILCFYLEIEMHYYISNEPECECKNIKVIDIDYCNFINHKNIKKYLSQITAGQINESLRGTLVGTRGDKILEMIDECDFVQKN